MRHALNGKQAVAVKSIIIMNFIFPHQKKKREKYGKSLRYDVDILIKTT